jgi:hypothetical protein
VVQGGAGRIEFDGKAIGVRGGNSTVESPGWSTATDRFAITVIGGAATIDIIRR